MRGASVAESTQSSVSLWQSVISRTPAACQMRSGLSEFSSPTPPSTAMKEAILPAAFALVVVGRPPRRQKHVRMRLLDAADEVDLLERGAGRMGRAGRLERRPELRPDHAFAQARDVGVGALVHRFSS